MIMRKKFTLIELLIVIAVIAILLSLLLPALQSAKQKVYTASCVNSMRQIGQAIYLYINDNNDYPPAPAIFSASCRFTVVSISKKRSAGVRPPIP